MKYIYVLIVILFFGYAPLPAFGQVERGGLPRSFRFQQSLKSQFQSIEVTAPDLFSIQQEDDEDARREKSYRVGVEIPVLISSANAGQWDELPGGGRIWRIKLICKGAQAIGLNYNEIRLPAGSDIFLYTPDYNSVIGAMTKTEIPQNQVFATRPLAGDVVILEYYEPAQVAQQGLIEISGLVYMYRGFDAENSKLNKSVSSGSCEVNVNCDEGINWQKQKRGVVKIFTKVGSKYFLCSGSLLNNTAQDFKGLLLTASHCSMDNSSGVASNSDYNQWIFYFNYEYSGCSNSASPPKELTIVGAQKLAISQTLSEKGSDFLLMQSLISIPAQYKAFYCGWDAENESSYSGVCIHHPDGDVKKISTYTTQPKSGTNLESSTPNTAWLVTWDQTTNGYGVTEGGSSGSPLFDKDGLVIGTLTGGYSECAFPTLVDYFGKVSFSWSSNGTSPDKQLKPWLDPGNILEGGILKMNGTFNDKLAVADFSADNFVIPIGGTVDFIDLSAGSPTKWHWYFQGGKPRESTEKNPSGIIYESFGTKNVKLVVSNEYNTDSVVKEQFIDVRAVVSPNPCNGTVNILTEKNSESKFIIEVFDYLGRIAQRFDNSGSFSESFSISLPEHGNVFFIRILQGDQVQTHKVVVIH